MKSVFEQMGGTYRQEGDYLLPNLELPPQDERPLGKYGRMRLRYIIPMAAVRDDKAVILREVGIFLVSA